MPCYDYKCEDCQKEFEENRFINDRDDENPCPLCGGMEVHRIIKPSRLALRSYREELADLPGEIQAIEAGMYDTGAEVDAVIKQAKEGTYYNGQ